jgi:hypothetical protein
MSLPRLSRWLGGVLIVLLLVGFVLHKDTEIQTDIWIERPPTDVWQILTATDEYPSWNPFIRLVGRLSNGILRKTQRGFVAMNKALKERAESR